MRLEPTAVVVNYLVFIEELFTNIFQFSKIFNTPPPPIFQH